MSSENILFIVNPNASGNKNGKTWDRRYEQIEKLLDPSIQSESVIVDGIGSGIIATIDAIKDGDYTKLIAVGGEGTINEVVNGIYLCSSNIPLGFIKGGTVNDYLQVINWPKTLEGQVEVINRGLTRSTPIVKAVGDESRIALNMADIGVAAQVSYAASVKRQLKWIKSSFRYTLLALKEVIKWNNIPVTITLDDKVIDGELSLFMSGFSKQIGEYKSLPHADPFGERMAYAIATDLSRLSIIKLMGPLHDGKHVADDVNIFMGHTLKAKIEADIPILLEVDGEPFSYNSSNITIESLPNALNVLDPNIN